MKRAQILERLYINVPEDSVIPVIVDTDAKNEADDQYAIMHHLLSPKLKILGIVAAHYESKATVPGTTMEKSYEEIAEITGLTLTNVATKLSRIKDKLKKMNKEE